MAPQAHQVDKLVKVGLEGFTLLDEFHGRKKKSTGSRVLTTTTSQAYEHHRYYNYNNQQQYVYRGPPVITVQDPIMDSNQAAKLYGGISIVDHNMGKPIRGFY